MVTSSVVIFTCVLFFLGSLLFVLLFGVNNISEEETGVIRKPYDVVLSANYRAHKLQRQAEEFDSVRSGESVIKHFSFDTSQYNGNTNKCIQFWKDLSQVGIQPVNCTLIKPYSAGDEEESEEGEGERELKSKETLEDANYMWYKALVELQRNRMDEVAFATTSNPCKFCSNGNPYSDFKGRQKPRFSDEDLRDTEDITCLNYWVPVQGKQKDDPKIKKEKDASPKPTGKTESISRTTKEDFGKPKSDGAIVSHYLETSSKDELKKVTEMPSQTRSDEEKHHVPFFLHMELRTFKDKRSKSECDCRRETCKCDVREYKDSKLHHDLIANIRRSDGYIVGASKDERSKLKCDCRKETCKSNEEESREWKQHNLIRSTQRSDDCDVRASKNEGSQLKCDCRKETCRCNEEEYSESKHDLSGSTRGLNNFNAKASKHKESKLECDCRKETCKCNEEKSRESEHHDLIRSTQRSDDYDVRASKDERIKSKCDCRKETFKCNEEESRESKSYDLIRSTQRLDEFNAIPSKDKSSKSECDCRKETCACNKVLTTRPNLQTYRKSLQALRSNNIITSTVAEKKPKSESLFKVDAFTSENCCPVDDDNIVYYYTTAKESERIDVNFCAKQKASEEFSEEDPQKQCSCNLSSCTCGVKANEGSAIICRKCQLKCNCYAHKIELCKRFIDDIKFEKHCKEMKRDQGVQMEIEETQKGRFCVICGHDDCNCAGPVLQSKRFLSVELDDKMITGIPKQKDKKSLTKPIKNAELTKELVHERSACCEMKAGNVETEQKLSKLPKVDVPVKKILYVTPAQRAKEIKNRKLHILQTDKYGIPQVVQYADGRQGPKRQTSEDISSSSVESIN